MKNVLKAIPGLKWLAKWIEKRENDAKLKARMEELRKRDPFIYR